MEKYLEGEGLSEEEIRKGGAARKAEEAPAAV